jgi:hypothetical protein
MPRPLSHNGLVILKVKGSDYRKTYSGLLWTRIKKLYRPGWTAMKFREIFGKWPRPLTPVEPIPPDAELQEYLFIMNARYAARIRRQERQKERDERDEGQRLELQGEAMAAQGLMPSFMTAEDWDYLVSR